MLFVYVLDMIFYTVFHIDVAFISSGHFLLTLHWRCECPLIQFLLSGEQSAFALFMLLLAELLFGFPRIEDSDCEFTLSRLNFYKKYFQVSEK